MSQPGVDSTGGMSARVFFAVLLVGLALLVQTFEQTGQLRRQQAALDTSFARQGDTLQQAQKLRAQLEGIAGDTAVLAEQGNPNAIKLRDYLLKQGVTIRPPGTPR